MIRRTAKYASSLRRYCPVLASTNASVRSLQPPSCSLPRSSFSIQLTWQMMNFYSAQPSANMHFKRIINSSYPCIYNTWKTDDGAMIIQDLAPEDDEAAMKILEENMITDEVLCNIQKLSEDPVSMQEMMDFWRDCLKQRMSIGCYEEKNGQKTLVALNVCIVGSEGDDHEFDFKGEKWRNVYEVIMYAESKANAYKLLGLQTLLHAMGLVVKREYRGRQLGQKILAAREPLCLSQGIKGTATVFTGIASQKPAIRCGFQTIADFPIRELAEIGLPYPRDDERRVKYMIKKFE